MRRISRRIAADHARRRGTTLAQRARHAIGSRFRTPRLAVGNPHGADGHGARARAVQAGLEGGPSERLHSASSAAPPQARSTDPRRVVPAPTLFCRGRLSPSRPNHTGRTWQNVLRSRNVLSPIANAPARRLASARRFLGRWQNRAFGRLWFSTTRTTSQHMRRVRLEPCRERDTAKRRGEAKR